jgi:TfoX/Sxy family transcriptional regulator of competence genes
MPGFEKSPPALVARFAAIAEELPDVERRQMFGYPCVFVGGNMITGLHDRTWFVRLGTDDAGELQALGGGAFEPMPGRPMRGYTTMPTNVIEDDAAVRRWVGLAIAHGRSLPTKVKKPAKGR